MTERQYVIFKLEKEEYGIDIINVREITEYKETTRIPNAPDYMDGIINLRGTVIPVINLKKRLNLSGAPVKNDSRVIIVNIGEKQIGFVVDDASQVLTLNEENIDEPSDLITGIDRQYIVGIGKVDEKIIILLDLIAIISEN